MSEQVLKRHQRIASWVRRRGVELGELWSIFASFVYAWRAVDVVDGKAVAPLTWKLLLEVNDGAWFWLLMVNGFVVMAALLMGLLTGNTYRYRSYISLASCVVWVLVATAAAMSQMPLSVAIGYYGTCVASWITALILSQKAVYSETRHRLEGGLECGRNVAI